jgi:hypothetical protein
VFPVRYELNLYIVFRRNSVFKVLISIAAARSRLAPRRSWCRVSTGTPVSFTQYFQAIAVEITLIRLFLPNSLSDVLNLIIMTFQYCFLFSYTHHALLEGLHPSVASIS